MHKVTQILAQMGAGDPTAAEQLLPLVYAELRSLAAARLDREPSGQTLQPTALVHEAYLRLVDVDAPQSWDSRGHFFAAAAEAMRRILVDNARRKACLKRGGEFARQDVDPDRVPAGERYAELVDLNDALTRLSENDPVAAELVKLRYFAGLTMEQAAETLAMSPRNAYYAWTYARTWLRHELREV